jgi:hypothetical protein
MTGIYVDNDNLRIKNTFNDLITPEPSEITLVNPNSTSTPTDDDLKSQLSKLKLMFDEGLLSKEAYDDRVELMLDKYGFN